MNPIPKREVRYQGAVIQNDQLLLIKHTEHDTGHSYWLLPGGGIEPGETEEGCVVRELLEETGLAVEIERLLIQQETPTSDFYKSRKTYLCRVISGNAAPGFDPEPFAIERYEITDVLWINLDQPETWGSEVTTNERLMPQLHNIVEMTRSL